MNFYSADDTQSARIQSQAGKQLGDACLLEDGEAIIGVYGVKDLLRTGYFSSIGFLVYNTKAWSLQLSQFI